jgi:hypothetical protein
LQIAQEHFPKNFSENDKGFWRSVIREKRVANHDKMLRATNVFQPARE